MPMQCSKISGYMCRAGVFNIVRIHRKPKMMMCRGTRFILKDLLIFHRLWAPLFEIAKLVNMSQLNMVCDTQRTVDYSVHGADKLSYNCKGPTLTELNLS